MYIYRIPLKMRCYVRHSTNPLQGQPIVLGGKGAIVTTARFHGYDGDSDHSVFHVKDQFCVLQANSLMEAIAKFLAEWDGAQIGGPGETDKALWIDRTEIIVVYSLCPRIRELRGNYACAVGDDIANYCTMNFDGSDRNSCQLKPELERRWTRADTRLFVLNGLEYRYFLAHEGGAR